MGLFDINKRARNAFLQTIRTEAEWAALGFNLVKGAKAAYLNDAGEKLYLGSEVESETNVEILQTVKQRFGNWFPEGKLQA